MAASLADGMDAEMVRHLVSRSITCPNTGQVLDARTKDAIKTMTHDR